MLIQRLVNRTPAPNPRLVNRTASPISSALHCSLENRKQTVLISEVLMMEIKMENWQEMG